MKGLRSHGVIVAECTSDMWNGVEDKSRVIGFLPWLTIFFRYLIAYPALIFRYLRAPAHDVVFVGYMGHFDVIVLWPFAKMRGAKIVWDAFLSLYGTVVEDRKLFARGHLVAHALSVVEKLACLAADVVVLDTQAHGEYFRKRYGLCKEKMLSVWVGAETDIFRCDMKQNTSTDNSVFNVLFYGQYIPLHGIEYIVDAASRMHDQSVHWTIIGRGQDRANIDALIEQSKPASLTLIDWVEYAKLPELIAQADLCLGIFGDSDKARRVIPNKVFQILAVGKPFVTANTPAIREIVNEQTPGVWLVPAGSGAALAQAVAAARASKNETPHGQLYPGMEQKISPDAVAASLLLGLKAAL